MRLSKRSEYALRALVALARISQDRMMQIQEVSKAEAIPVKFLEQILLALRHGGILSSRRGVNGGYSFARRADTVMVGEVIRLMDGPLAPVPCASPSHNSSANSAEACTCPDPSRCSLRLFMSEVRDGLTELLDNKSIAELASMRGDGEMLEFQI